MRLRMGVCADAPACMCLRMGVRADAPACTRLRMGVGADCVEHRIAAMAVIS